MDGGLEVLCQSPIAPNPGEEPLSGEELARCRTLRLGPFPVPPCAFAGLFRSRAELEAEILVLRHQLNVLRRKSPGRLAFSSIDRLVFAGMYALAPNILDALKIVKPEPCSVGIVPAFGPIGAGNRDHGAGGRVLQPKFATSFAR